MTDGSNGNNGKDVDADAAGKLGPEAVIAHTDRPLTEVVVPILALLAALLVFIFASAFIPIDCKHYFIMMLAYPFFFGAAGVVLGGAVSLHGKLTLFGFPWTGQVVGGVGAALLGFAIVFFVPPPSCNLRHELKITNLPLTQPDQEIGQLKYFVTVEPDSNVDMQVGADGDRKALAIAFKGNFSSRLSIRAYQRDGNNYSYLASCDIVFDPSEDQETEKSVIHRSKPAQQLSLKFNQKYFDKLNAAKTQSIEEVRNLCLTGSFSTDGHDFVEEPAIAPIQVARQSDRLLVTGDSNYLLVFSTKKQAPAATKENAREPSTASGEVLTSAGTGSVAPATPVIQASVPVSAGPNVVLPPPPASAGCSFASNPLRGSVDSFLSGNDLDRPTRLQIYRVWNSVNCYVLPLARNSAGNVPALTQSRAIKLLINAIINNSTIPDNPLYWQPNGDGVRNFKTNLPYVGSDDLQYIFKLVDSTDDLVRTEAIRFVKSLPVDAFEGLFRNQLASLAGLTNQQTTRFATAASGLYYNRITEWLNASSDVDKASAQRAVVTDFDQSQNWTRDALFSGEAAKGYAAMVRYGKGIVQRELQIGDNGVADFAAMLALLKQTSEVYPSRAIHIAQALAITSSGSDAVIKEILHQIQSVDELATAIPLDESSPFAGKLVPLYAGPRQDYPRLVGALGTHEGGSLVLHQGNWYFARAHGKIGWIAVPQ